MTKRLVVVLGCAMTTALLAADSPTPCTPQGVNGNCTITIDRDAPVAPLPVRLRPSAKATITVDKRPTETITFTVDLKQIETADPGLAILKAVLPSFTSIVGSSKRGPFEGLTCRTGKPENPVCIIQEQEKIAATLDNIKKTVTTANQSLAKLLRTTTADWKTDATPCKTEPDLFKEIRAAVDTDINDATKLVLPTFQVAALQTIIDNVKKSYSPKDDAQKALAELLDRIDAHQTLIVAGIKALGDAQTALAKATASLDTITTPTFHEKREYNPTVLAGSGTSATVTLKAQDLVTQESATLPTINVTWTDTPWSISTGAVFSSLPKQIIPSPPN